MRSNRKDKRTFIGIAASVAALALLVFIAPAMLPISALSTKSKADAISADTEMTSGATSGTSGEPRTMDEAFSSVETKLPGFAGYFLDSEGKLNVYMTNPASTDISQIISAVVPFVDAGDLAKGVNIMEGKRAWHEYKAWKQTLRQLFNDKELGVTTLDIDEKNQMLSIGFEKLDDSKRATATQFLAANGVPRELVELKETGPIVTESHGISVVPRKGGIEIGFGTGTSCTNSFIADRTADNPDLRVSVTNGHCEIGVDAAGDQTYRNPAPLGSTTVGTEVANTNIQGSRFSDTLLWAPATGISTSLSKICKGTSCPSTPQYTITGVKLFPAVGELVYKYGRSTHETSGTITATDVDTTHPNYGNLWSQDQATYSSASGDSGSPVFKKVSGDNVTLYGIHWGINQFNPDVKFFSPFLNIETDQGDLKVN